MTHAICTGLYCQCRHACTFVREKGRPQRFTTVVPTAKRIPSVDSTLGIRTAVCRTYMYSWHCQAHGACRAHLAWKSIEIKNQFLTLEKSNTSCDKIINQGEKASHGEPASVSLARENWIVSRIQSCIIRLTSQILSFRCVAGLLRSLCAQT